MGGLGEGAISAVLLLAVSFWLPALGIAGITGTVIAIILSRRSRPSPHVGGAVAPGHPAYASDRPAAVAGWPSPVLDHPAPAAGWPAPAFGQPTAAAGHAAVASGQPTSLHPDPAAVAPWHAVPGAEAPSRPAMGAPTYHASTPVPPSWGPPAVPHPAAPHPQAQARKPMPPHLARQTPALPSHPEAQARAAASMPSHLDAQAQAPGRSSHREAQALAGVPMPSHPEAQAQGAAPAYPEAQAQAPTPPRPGMQARVSLPPHPLAPPLAYPPPRSSPAATIALAPLAPRRALAIDPAPVHPGSATMHDLLSGTTDSGRHAPQKPLAPPAPPAPERREPEPRLGLVERDDPPRVLVRSLPGDLAFDMQRIGDHWMLLPDDGPPVELTGEVAIVGRSPSPDARYPGAQLIAVRHATVSKTHARIERRGTGWLVTDLASTNGVVVVDGDGSDYDATPGAPAHIREMLRLGELELRVSGAA